MTSAEGRALRVFFLCTGNSARSQIAEAILNRKGAGQFVAASAGSKPAARVNPHAIRILEESGIERAGAPLRHGRIDLLLALPVGSERLTLEAESARNRPGW